MPTIKLIFALTICFILIASCSHAQPTRVYVSGTSIPTFSFSGSGRLRVFEVYESQLQGDGGEVLTRVWSIENFPDGVPLNKMGTVTFGIDSQGFKQSYPGGGVTPSLNKERAYEYWLWVDGRKEVVGTFFYNDGHGWMNAMVN